MNLYHATTEKNAKMYHDSGCIKKPVRGFTSLMGAMAWACKTGRKVIYRFDAHKVYKLPDHHNKYGEAWWTDVDVALRDLVCVFSADKDA